MELKRPNLKARMTFYGPEWAAIRDWLEVEREVRVRKLIHAKDQDDSQKHRGAIEIIDTLLREEKDAAQAASN